MTVEAGKQKPLSVQGVGRVRRAGYAVRTPRYTTCPAWQRVDTNNAWRASARSSFPDCGTTDSQLARRPLGCNSVAIGYPAARTGRRGRSTSGARNARSAAPSSARAGASQRPRAADRPEDEIGQRGPPAFALDAPRPGHEPVDRERADRLLGAGAARGRSRPRSRGSGRRTRAACSRSRTGSAAERASRDRGAARRAGRTAPARPRRGTSRGSAAGARRPRTAGSGRTTPGRPSRSPARTRADSAGRAASRSGRSAGGSPSHASIEVWAIGPLRPHRPRGGTWTSGTPVRTACSSANRSRSGQRVSRWSPSALNVRGSASTKARPIATTSSRSTPARRFPN